jgi:hypothetical protein
MKQLLVYSAKKSNRLSYVLDWLFKEQLEMDYRLVHDTQGLENAGFMFAYGNASLPGALSIPDVQLLWDKGVTEHEISTGTWGLIPTLYDASEALYTLPFDLFSAIFFLLSRYEEYYTYTPDAHDRYPATQSILFKMRCLQRPLIDEWVQTLRELMRNQFGIHTPEPKFSYRPTYDIDIAYSYKYKGFVRTAGAQARDIWARKKEVYKERMAVVMNQKADPYDSHDWIRSLHANKVPRPLFFILASAKTTPYDKNISPSHLKMQKLIKQIAGYADVALHPSYFSDNDETLANEKAVLENIVQQAINISRQHYIKLKLPDTFLRLMRCGISQDYSMGYGTHLGFRAGTGKSFFWYSLNNEFTTPLRTHPFCFMDTTAMFDEKLSLNDSFDRLRSMTKILQRCGSHLNTIFHNFSLGSAPEWDWWKGKYKEFLGDLDK